MMCELSLVIFLSAFTVLFASDDDFMAAIEAGDKEKLVALVSNGTDINKCLQPMDETPLNFAILKKQEELAILLIEMGADLNATCAGTRYGHPIATAAIEGTMAVVKALLRNGVELDGEFLSDIISDDKIDIIGFYSAKDFDPDKQYPVFNRTWLYFAAAYGRVNLTKRLLEQGADMEHKDYYGNNALIMACRGLWNTDSTKFGNLEKCAEMLIDGGANVNTIGENERTPLIYAAERNSTILVKKLVEKGADVNAVDRWGNSAWSMATRRGYEDIAKFLLDHGADINKGK